MICCWRGCVLQRASCFRLGAPAHEGFFLPASTCGVLAGSGVVGLAWAASVVLSSWSMLGSGEDGRWWVIPHRSSTASVSVEGALSMSAEEPDLVSRNKVPFRQTAGSWRRRDLAGRRPGRGGHSSAQIVHRLLWTRTPLLYRCF